MFEKTKAFCDFLLTRGLPGFDLNVYKNGECLLRYMNGYSDIENEIKINGKERYNIYSCSKGFTCVAALQLLEKGLFSLEDKLSDYMPEFAEMTVKTENGVKKAENPILIKHLFEMTAGFSYTCASPELLRAREETGGACPTRETMKYLAKEPLLFEPGDQYKYSLCHDVLAALVEVISGEKFEDYVKKNIFDAVGMNDSTFMLPESELSTVSGQYRFKDGAPRNVGKNIVTYKLGREYASGGAGAISTVDDYMKFLEALRTDKLLKPETRELMMTDRLTDYQKRTYDKRHEYGYGLGVRCPKEGGKALDFGWGGAACAYWGIDMTNKISIYFGAHLLSSPVQGIRSLTYSFVLAELAGDDEAIEQMYKNLSKLYDYNLTY